MLNLLLAAVEVPEPSELLNPTPKGGFRLDATDTLLVLGAILLVAAILFCWAYFIRKRPTSKAGTRALVAEGRPRSSRSRSHHSHGENGRKVRMRKRRREHPDNFPRNPTRGETGGLPPIRPDEPDSPAQLS